MKIKILSYNIHKGFTIGNTDFILNKMKQAIREVDADILFLQEVQGHHSDTSFQIPDWKTAAQFEYLADSLWPHFAYGKNAIYTEGHHGNAILSKFPIMDWMNVDISTNRFEQRGFLKAKIEIPEIEKELILMNTHLNLTQAGRNKQIRVIIDDLKKEADNAWVFLGDFNDWNKKIAKQVQEELKVKEAFDFLHGHYPATFPSFLPVLSLDRIFFNGVKAIKAEVLDFGHWRSLSDHLPLFFEIDI